MMESHGLDDPEHDWDAILVLGKLPVGEKESYPRKNVGLGHVDWTGGSTPRGRSRDRRKCPWVRMYPNGG